MNRLVNLFWSESSHYFGAYSPVRTFERKVPEESSREELVLERTVPEPTSPYRRGCIQSCHRPQRLHCPCACSRPYRLGCTHSCHRPQRLCYPEACNSPSRLGCTYSFQRPQRRRCPEASTSLNRLGCTHICHRNQRRRCPEAYVPVLTAVVVDTAVTVLSAYAV